MATTIQIGDASVNFSTLCIEGPAGRFSMEPKVMNLLQVLVDNTGTVVARHELLDQVWNETPGGDESLSRAVSLLRRAFGEVRGGHRYIETVPKRGYRLVAELSTQQSDKLEPIAPTTARSDTQVDRPSTPNQPPRPPRKFLWIAGLGLFFIAAIASYLLIDGVQTGDSGGSASEVSIAKPTAQTAALKSIAVLPFEDLSNAGDQQYLSDGLAEEILNTLVRFPDLRVMGRTSSFIFRDSELDLGEVNAALSVSHLLTGSVRKQGNRVRVTARLVQAEDGYNLWSDTYDGDLSDIFDLQEDIAREIARNLGVLLNLSGQERLVPKLTDNRQAYELFLQGRALARKFGHRNKAKAKELLERAVALDPNFAAAWAWLGQANLYLTLTARSTQMSGLISAASYAVNQSLNLDPGLAMGHIVQTKLLGYKLDFAGSLDSVEKAYQLNPYQPFVAIRRGAYYSLIGQTGKGVELMEQALQWDPTDSIGLVNLGVAKQAMGQLDQATSLMRRSEDLGFVPAAGQACFILKLRGQSEAASLCWSELSDDFRLRYSPLFQQGEEWLLLGQALFLDSQPAQQAVAEILDQYFAEQGSRANSYMLQLYVLIGSPERFMHTFLSHPFPFNTGAIITIWDDQKENRALRQHPDFSAFAERIGLVRAWQKYGWPDRCQKYAGTDGSNGQFSCG